MFDFLGLGDIFGGAGDFWSAGDWGEPFMGSPGDSSWWDMNEGFGWDFSGVPSEFGSPSEIDFGFPSEFGAPNVPDLGADAFSGAGDFASALPGAIPEISPVASGFGGVGASIGSLDSVLESLGRYADTGNKVMGLGKSFGALLGAGGGGGAREPQRSGAAIEGQGFIPSAAQEATPIATTGSPGEGDLEQRLAELGKMQRMMSERGLSGANPAYLASLMGMNEQELDDLMRTQQQRRSKGTQ